jgi:hypothetical protein
VSIKIEHMLDPPKQLAAQLLPSLPTSEYEGVFWKRDVAKWMATIRHDGKRQHLGTFDDETEAARAFDTVARRLRGDDAHGGKWTHCKPHRWLRVNFPTQAEVLKRAQERGAPFTISEEDKAAAAASALVQGPSQFVGVGWDISVTPSC